MKQNKQKQHKKNRINRSVTKSVVDWTYRIGLTFQESVQESNGIFQFFEIVWVSWCFCEDLWIVVVGKSLVQSSQVKVQTLVYQSASLWVGWVKWSGFTVLFNQVHHNGTWFPQCKTIINQSWHGVLRINLIFLKKKIEIQKLYSKNW